MGKEVKKPNFFIVGAPKCGTTAMYEYLRQHPDIFMPDIKEPHFFCTDFESPYYIRDLDSYLALFSKARDEKRIGEASATYLRSERAAEGIKAFCPAAKIIIILRNPVDMLYSLHSQFLYDGNEDIEDFEAALKAENDRGNGLRVPASKYPPRLLLYRCWVHYTGQVKRYFDAFAREDIQIIVFEDLRENTVGVYTETLRFLGVDEGFTPDFKIVNPNKRARSRFLKKYIEEPPRFLQVIVRAALTPAMREKVFALVQKVYVDQAKREPINTELKSRLQEEFRGEVEKLSALIGRDLRHWTNS